MLRSETATSPGRRARALAGLRRYQDAPRARRTMGPVRHRKGAARLRDYGGDGAPVVFVPSLINPPFVLDLAPGRSLVRWIAEQGFHAWLVDWGTPSATDAALDLAGHVTERLLPLLAKLERPPVLVGYCLGGTIALAAADLLGERCAGVATIAAPWRFDGYGTAARAEMTAMWRAADPVSRRLGALPMEVMQAGFWRLDPARTVAKYEAFAEMDDAAAATFVALEDWANAGAPLTHAAGADLFDALLGQDLPGRGAWRVGGRVVTPEQIACPVAEFVSLTDRITPAATAARVGVRHDLAAGHVGMVVGSKGRAMLWEPLAAWLRGVADPTRTSGGERK
ncbi:poly-beta-hydroxybutyrate polymerase [Sphingomonas sp. Leaf412]|uniref:alpha/beta hydrolase n=1 Tax=Sphingomonas sp. Leaf412 TaxID=1736370 RepID=UPI0006FB9EA0|nr:alpha/beta hydrolase [Sphingomonas sp. Leaf412]KQT31206.1 poly-beta-hydroxybutyrate polymerase [Sphingomonas sp. Leaf412]